MEVTFWGVRGSIPSPGPATVRYGGNTACVTVRTAGGGLFILDCGTGARNLGNSLLATEFGKGGGEATMLLSHTQWGHIQGFPFFVPAYIAGNRFTIFGVGKARKLEGILEGQMAPQYFPVQTLKNMGANIEIKAAPEGKPVTASGCTIQARSIPHGKRTSVAFRIDEGPKSLVYVSTAGYGEAGIPANVIDLYRGADVLVHDATYSPEDKARYPSRGFSSIDDAVGAALAARVHKLVLFSYDQDYSDADVDALVERSRRLLDERGGRDIACVGAAEGASFTV